MLAFYDFPKEEINIEELMLVRRAKSVPEAWRSVVERVIASKGNTLLKVFIILY